MKTSARRRCVLGLLFAGAAWLAAFGEKTPQQTISWPVARETVAPLKASTVTQSSARPAAPRLLALLPRETLFTPATAAPADLFSTRNWTPAPPPIMAASAPPPMAPPLPYIYAGKKQEAGHWEVYLMRGETAYIVRQGASLEETYLVERIEPPIMTLRYRPLDQQQSLTIGE